MNKKLLTYIGTFFLLAAIAAGVKLVFQNQSIVKEAAPATSLSISPSTQNKYPGETFTLSVKLDAGVNKVVGYDVQINFDSDAFDVTNVGLGEASEGFTLVKDDIDNNNGSVLYSVFNLDKTQFLSGSGLTILNLTVKVKQTAANGNYVFDFDPSSAVAALSEPNNALMLTTPANVVISNQQVKTPTPAPTSGEPNSCNGTCGSNFNCKANLFCHNGYCRKPECPNDSSCGCSATASPRPTNRPVTQPIATRAPLQTASTRPTITPVPTDDDIVYYDFDDSPKSPIPTLNTFDSIDDSPVTMEEDQVVKKPWDLKTILVTVLAGLALIYATFLLIKTIKSTK